MEFFVLLRYQYVPHGDNNVFYGSNFSGQWTGLVGMVVNDTTDLCIADFSMTPERREVVDFTMPLFKTRFTRL